jgi:hypothetical protein
MSAVPALCLPHAGKVRFGTQRLHLPAPASVAQGSRDASCRPKERMRRFRNFFFWVCQSAMVGLGWAAPIPWQLAVQKLYQSACFGLIVLCIRPRCKAQRHVTVD